MADVAGIFERRGNPWISEKDRAKDYPRTRNVLSIKPISDERRAAIDAINDVYKLLKQPDRLSRRADITYSDAMEDADIDCYMADKAKPKRERQTPLRLVRSSRSRTRTRAIGAIRSVK